jgi:hypothetical protein
MCPNHSTCPAGVLAGRRLSFSSAWIRGSALAAGAWLLGSPLEAVAQSDNFDSGALSPAWTLYAANPALVSLTFPTNGNGKALRIQVNPYAALGVPAVAGIAQSNVYTDFYAAVDLVNWVVENQAAVIIARFAPGGNFGLDGGQGMICNYDAAQEGDSAGNRQGGQFQINIVEPGFKTTTLAACDMTPVPGHSYRLVFTGVGQLYTGMLYDLDDLTTPLATIQATDPAATVSSGISGFVSYSRNSDVGTTDVTIDNYYAGATDPNLAAPPALMHPIPGTPIVETRLPAGRWQNFYNPTSGISFVAKTYTTDVVSLAATKLALNGVDVSSQLTLSASVNGTVVTGSLPGSALRSNSLYSARISSADTTGLKTSVNTFWFDTFSDAFVSAAPAKTIECEDYNYSNGVFQLDPIPVSGLVTNANSQVNGEGVGYFDSGDMVWLTMGTEGVDFHTTVASPQSGWDDYRPNDPVMTGQGLRQEIEDDPHPDEVPPWIPAANPYDRPNDNTRQKYAAVDMAEYLVVNTHAADWLNYTRVFGGVGNYFALLRVGAFFATTVSLGQVTSDPSQTNQTVAELGAFTVPNLIRRSNFLYVPLLDTNGLGVILSLSGTNTLRLTMGGNAGDGTYDDVLALNYLLLMPAQVSVQSAALATGPYADDPAATLNVAARTVTLPATGASAFYRLETVAPVRIRAISVAAGIVTLKY